MVKDPRLKVGLRVYRNNFTLSSRDACTRLCHQASSTVLHPIESGRIPPILL
jgi:hypothetical protein